MCLNIVCGMSHTEGDVLLYGAILVSFQHSDCFILQVSIHPFTHMLVTEKTSQGSTSRDNPACIFMQWGLQVQFKCELIVLQVF